MTTLSKKEIEERWSVTKSEVDDYIKRNKLRLPTNTKALKAFRNRVRRKLRNVKISDTIGSSQSFAYEIAPWQIIYGQTKIGGLVSFVTTMDNRRNLDLVLTLSGHEINSVDELWLDNELVLFGASPDPRWSTQIYNPDDNRYRAADTKVFMAVNNGNVGNAAIADLVARHPTKWTSDHKQTGRAHAFIILVWEPTLFPNGVPDISFVVRGKKVYNFVTTTTEYSNNAARVIADYLMDATYGLGCALSELETAPGAPGSFYDAQQICAQQVQKRDGTYEDRYTINGSFTTDDSPQNIIEKMLTACGGTLSYSGGKWKLFPAAWVTPRIVLDEGDVIDELNIQTKISRRDVFNGVRGTFVSKQKDYLEDDFPPVKNDYYMSLDNGERVWEDIQLPLTTSDATAQRLAKILLEEARQQIEVSGTFGLNALQVEVGEPVCIVNSRMGWGDPRENYLLWSEDLTKTSAWTYYAITVDSVATDTPFGSNRPAHRQNETTANAIHAAAQSFAAASGTTYAFKWLVKASGRTYCRCYMENSVGTPFPGSNLAIVVNLSTGAVVSAVGADSYSVRSLGSGWYEVNATKAATASGTGLISTHNGLDGTTFGYAGTVGQGILIGGVQVKRNATINAYTWTKDAQAIATGTPKLFVPQEVEPTFEDDSNSVPRLGVRLLLRETASGIFDWNNGEETGYDLSGNTDLPSPFDVPEITSLALYSGTGELYITIDGTVVSRIRAAWDTPTDGFIAGGGSIEVTWKPTAGATWSAPLVLPGNSSYAWILDVQDGVAYDVRVRAKNALNVYSDYSTVTGHVVVGKTAAPSNVTSLVAQANPYGVFLAWSAIADLDVDFYELRVGAPTDAYSAMTILAEVSGTTFQANLFSSGEYKFAIKAVDTSGNRSAAESTYTLTVGGPPAPILSGTIAGNQVRLEWTEVTGQFQVLDYVLRYGADWASATPIGNTQATVHQEEVTWGGERKFWIAARDVAGNIGTPSSTTITIITPSAPQSISIQVVDNNVLLRWLEPATGTLDVDYYKVFKGDTFAGSTQIGQVSATFTSIIELVGGTFTYWLQAFDTAGNAGVEASVSAVVNQPPDYVLRDVQTLDATNHTSSYELVDEGTFFVGATDPTDTWSGHFTGNSWTTIQDQIDDGYPYFIQPVSSGSGVEWDDIDYGAVLPPTIVTLTADIVELDGDTVFNIKLYHSTDGTSYTQVSGQTLSEYSRRWLVPAFRYLRVKIDATAYTGGDSAYILNGAELRLDVKQASDSGGPLTAPSTDTTTTATITIASPAVVTATAHGMVEGQQFEFTTTGALPTGLSVGTIYFCRNPAANTFNVSAEPQGALINTSGTQSGTHTVLRRGLAVFLNRTFIDLEGLNVTPSPTPAQRTANLPFTPVVSFKDSPYNTNFNVEIYDRTGARVACDFRWNARGI
jgi:hypothetical protein